MNHFQRSFGKVETSRSSSGSGMPASKRPRISSSRTTMQDPEDDDEDPFGDDITGEELEEWEYAASQAETILNQEQSKEPLNRNNRKQFNGLSNGTSLKIQPVRANRVKSSVSSNNAQLNNSLVKELQEKFAKCEKELGELEQSYKSKDGETLVLRDRLSKAEKDLTREKMKNFELQQRHEEAELEREKKMQKELEKYKDEVQFKQAEILESQNLIKNLETKNRLLEQNKMGQKGINSYVSPSRKLTSSDTGWSGTQDSTAIVAKKIRLVKPESPRVSVSGFGNKPAFDDEPLARKKASKTSPSKPSTSNTSLTRSEKTREKSHMDEKISSKLKLKSKYLLKGFTKQATFQELLSPSSQDKLNCASNFSSPILHLLNSKNSNPGCLKDLLSNSYRDDNIFGNLVQTRHCPTVNIRSLEENHEILTFVDGMLSSYVYLQDSLGNQGLSKNSSSSHTASLEQPNSDSVRGQSAPKERLVDCSSIQKDTVATLRVLIALTITSETLAISLLNQSSSILSNLLKMCDADRWHSKLEHCLHITMLSLEIVTNLAKLRRKDKIHMKKFQLIMKTELMIALLTHKNIRMKLVTMDVVAALVYHPAFALSVTKEATQAETPSILCHICDLSCSQQPKYVNVTDWLCLLSKIVTFLSILVAEHEDLLVANSCYSEIYRAADVMLYNELVCWKNCEHKNPKRLQLIKRALCLLHSCANVYADGIPGSRRDHRHQFVLTNLDDFLTKYSDKTSFWYQELSRIVKSEVEALFDELEIT